MAAKVDKDKCNGYATCRDVCPVNAIEMNNGKSVISDDCVECETCVDQCPNEAISI